MLQSLCKRAFPKALWVYHVNTGACNGCDIEVIDVLTPYYDAERFGIKLVGSPRHADVLLVSGPVTRQVEPALKRLYGLLYGPVIAVQLYNCVRILVFTHDERGGPPLPLMEEWAFWFMLSLVGLALLLPGGLWALKHAADEKRPARAYAAGFLAYFGATFVTMMIGRGIGF